MRRLLASFFGTGFIPKRLTGSDAGAGTVGAAAALLIAYAARPAGWVVQAVVASTVVLLGLWAAGPFIIEHPDPGWVVIDEAGGTLLATIGLAPFPALVAFVAFRVADVMKKWFPGVAAAERLRGSMGVVADDLVAGLYGLGAGWLAQWLFTT